MSIEKVYESIGKEGLKFRTKTGRHP